MSEDGVAAGHPLRARVAGGGWGATLLGALAASPVAALGAPAGLPLMPKVFSRAT